MIDQSYINTMDVFPLEAPEQNQLFQFYNYLREDRFTTTRCASCGQLSWPPRTVCPHCMSNQLEWVDMPKKGRLFGYTVQFAGVSPVFDVPLYLGVVEFDNGIKLLSRLVETTEDELEIGKEVEFTVLPVPGPGERVVYAFKPVK
ncbi:MAG: Zn-ribbon domain-containing OB-fold protein [Dehalococcoidales bacterium]|nr:Zn-ribbon domain-containing OB-fold protein [Dehalococcoidales bacterium]